MEPEQLREFVSENRELEQKLTKRNQQYIFDLKKSMAAANFSEEEKAKALHDILPALVDGQKKGITARQLYGTVSDCMDMIINKPAEMPESTPLTMWLDNFLIVFGVLGIMFALMNMFSTDRATTVLYGITTLIVASAVGAWVLYLMYKYIYQYDRPGADKSKKPKMWKSMLIIVGATLVWFIGFTASAWLPSVINPVIDPLILVVLGGAALALRYYLKKKYGFVGSFSMRQ